MRFGRRGLFEFITSLAALYVCIGTTPLGELAKRGFAWATGMEHAQRPLTSFFSGTEPAGPDLKVRPFREDQQLWRQVERRSRNSGLDAALVMAGTLVLGEQPAWPPGVRRELRQARVDPDGADALAQALRHYQQRLGSESAAVAALFSGERTVARALSRSRSSGLAAPDRFAAFGRYLAPSERMAMEPQVNRIMALAIAHRLGWPVPEDTRISSPFGPRLHPILKKRIVHRGIDLAVPRGTRLHASADGRVRYAGRDGVNGNYLKIDHGYGLATVLCHNTKNLVDTGDAVRRRAVVGTSGSTGRSTGPHLHFGVKVGGQFVDPLPLLRFSSDMRAEN